MRLRTLLPAAALAAASLLLTACAAGGPAATGDAADGAASDSPQSLVVYSGRDEELVAPLIERFSAETGIQVDVRYAGTSELAAQLLEEGDRSPAHVFLSQDAGALGELAAAGMFVELPESVTSLVDTAYTSQDGTWVGLTGRARVIAYDSEKYTADEVPADVFELTGPEWRGKVGIAPSNASFQSFVTAMRVAEGEERAQQWLEGLLANDVQIFAKNGEILEAVNSGALDLGLINHYYWARSEQDPTTLRAQIKFGEPGSVSALVNVTGAGILATGAENPSAQAFVEYLLSESAQEYFLTETFEYPLVDGMPGPAGVPPLEELGGPDIDLAQLSSLSETVELLTRVGLI